MRLGISAVYTGGSVPGVIRPLTALDHRGLNPVIGLSHKFLVLGLVLGGVGEENGSAWHLASQAWEPWKHVFATQIYHPSPQTCMHAPAFSTVPTSFSWSSTSYWGIFPLLCGEPGLREAPGFLTFVSPLTCCTGSC